jgi:nitrate reductase gamma subunit
MYEPSPFLRFAEDKLQILALCFMAVVYLLKIRWIFSYPAGKDRQATTAVFTNASKGAQYSLLNIAMPWAMDSTRIHPFLYLQFVLFHVGVAVSILMSFLIPYAPHLIGGTAAIRTMQAIFAAAVIVGLIRLIRRLTDPYLRAVSTPDDYFSMTLLIVWLASSFAAAPNQPEHGEASLLIYFILTAFFLIYVPFSKISHYLYYPFSRWYLGRTLGYRGVFPIKKGPQAHA